MLTIFGLSLHLQSKAHAASFAHHNAHGKPSTLTAEAQAFDGPAPETINGRLAMLGVVTCLGAEAATNVGIQEQVVKAPLSILGTFVIISLASYIPIFR